VFAQTYNYFEIQKFINSDVFEPRYTCVYATAKTAADLISKTIAHQNSMKYCSGAICMSYGENNMSEMLPNIIMKKLIKGESPHLIEGNNLYDMIYISDIVDAFEALGRYGVDKKTYYVGHRTLKTFKELMFEIRDIVNPNVEVLFGKYKDNQQMDYASIDLDALYRDTGFEAKADFRESIQKTADWLRNLA
jgi:nucleoside-diphosphate-sugar epimerase